MENTKQKIIEFLKKFFKVEKISDDDNFFKLGFVNSLFVMQLIAFVEKSFSIKIENEDLEIENFNTINHIIFFIEKKLNP